MGDTGPPSGGHDPGDLAARLADAEQRLAIAERFQKEQLAVLTRALAAAQEIETRAQVEAAAIVDRARLDVTVLDHAATRLRLGNPELSAAIRAMRDAAARAVDAVAPSSAAADRSELEAARKRLAIYESFEDTIQSVLTTALRSAQQIRTRSEEESAAAAERLRAELRSVREELGQARAERDAITEIVAGLQSARDELLRQHGELEAAIAALKDERERLPVAMTEDERLERRRTERVEAEHAPPRAVPAATRAVPGDEREGLTALRREIAEDIERLRAERAAMARERDYQSDEVMRLRAERDAVAQQLAGLREAFAAALQELVRTMGQAPVGMPIPAAAAPEAAPSAPPVAAPAAAETPRTVVAEGELRLLIAPVASFSALVDLERRLQGFAGIRSVYVRDFRSGTATLTLNVGGGAGSLQDLADTLAREVGATVERVADGVIALKARPAASEASRKLTG